MILTFITAVVTHSPRAMTYTLYSFFWSKVLFWIRLSELETLFPLLTYLVLTSNHYCHRHIKVICVTCALFLTMLPWVFSTVAQLDLYGIYNVLFTKCWWITICYLYQNYITHFLLLRRFWLIWINYAIVMIWYIRPSLMYSLRIVGFSLPQFVLAIYISEQVIRTNIE